MKHIFVVAMFVLIGASRADAAPAVWQQAVIERQDITVTLMPADHLVIGASTLAYAAGTARISLKLSPAARIESVMISGVKAPFSFAAGTLSAEVPKTAETGSVLVTIAYRAIFNDPLPLHSGSSEDPTYGVNGVISDLGTFLGGGAGWYPVPSATPQKRSVRIAAPAGTEALTAGKRVSRRTQGTLSHSSWEEARPVGELSLCAGPYRIEERKVAGVDLYTYFYQENASLASRYLDAAAKYLNFYVDLFGPYPFEKFAVVENFFPTGYGFPSFTLLGSSIIRLPFIIDTSFPHEIAHSWWGNAIQPDQSEGNWSEGLVTYLADYLLKERRSAAEGREYRTQLLTDYAALVSPDNDFPIASFSSRIDPASRAIGYGKSAMLFHMIRKEIGDRAFFDALREICRERLYRSATWSDFEHAFSRHSGKDLSKFMKQWLNRPGGPQITFSKVTQFREGDTWTVSGSVMQSTPYYELQLPLRLDTGGPPVRTKLPLSRGLTPFRITSSAAPQQLLLDPDADIFRALAPNEIPVTVNSVKGSKQLLVVMTSNCKTRIETFKRFLESLGKGDALVIREEDLEPERMSGHDLLFCGAPQKKSLFPALPAGISLNSAGFSIDQNAAQAPDGLLFLVVRLRAPSERFAALFQPLSETAAEQYAPKITHYGKYGSLLFTKGVIRYKGTTPITAEESNVMF